MFHSITLPAYNKVAALDGRGNYAIKKYYKFPFRLFYRHKLKMIASIVRDISKEQYIYNIIDYGSGPGIFKEELKKHATKVYSYDVDSIFNASWRFDVAVCSSSLEFMQLHHELNKINKVLKVGGYLVVGSPMKTWVTNLYFRLIGDKNGRHSHEAIISAVSNYFKIEECKTWLGLYFTIKAYKK